MKTELITIKGIQYAHLQGDEILIEDVNTALDTFMGVQYETGCSSIALDKKLITEDFFDLRTKLAGEILQKCMNYNIRLVIYGDFSVYNSKALRDFIYESNHGKDFWFLNSFEELKY